MKKFVFSSIALGLESSFSAILLAIYIYLVGNKKGFKNPSSVSSSLNSAPSLQPTIFKCIQKVLGKKKGPKFHTKQAFASSLSGSKDRTKPPALQLCPDAEPWLVTPGRL